MGEVNCDFISLGKEAITLLFKEMEQYKIDTKGQLGFYEPRKISDQHTLFKEMAQCRIDGRG